MCTRCLLRVFRRFCGPYVVFIYVSITWIVSMKCNGEIRDKVQVFAVSVMIIDHFFRESRVSVTCRTISEVP